MNPVFKPGPRGTLTVRFPAIYAQLIAGLFGELISLLDDGQEPSTEVMRALGQVTRRATAMAIFTLGIAQRAHLTAHQN